MATIVLTDCTINIDSTDYTEGTKVAIAYEAAAVAQTAFGDDTEKSAGGLKKWSMSFEFNGDEATTGQLFAKVGTIVPVKVRASSAVVGPNNPSYEGDALITQYAPIDGAVGDNHKVSLTVVSAGPLSRVTA